MKLVASVYTQQQLNKFLNYIDGAILNFAGYSLIYEDLNIDEALAVCRKNHITPILAVNRLYHPKDMDRVRSLFIKYMAEDILFLITDIGAANLAMELSLIDRVIFDSQTMIANPMDLREYAALGFHSVSMSLEIPFADVTSAIEETGAKVFYQIFGHRLMFYSKRHLISLYEEKASIRAEGQKLYLREETRQEDIPVIENESGTMMYRPYAVSYLGQPLDSLSYGYLDSLAVPEQLFLEILKTYWDVIHQNISLSEGLERIQETGVHTEEGFTYCDSIYQKELF